VVNFRKRRDKGQTTEGSFKEIMFLQVALAREEKVLKRGKKSGRHRAVVDPFNNYPPVSWGEKSSMGQSEKGRGKGRAVIGMGLGRNSGENSEHARAGESLKKNGQGGKLSIDEVTHAGEGKRSEQRGGAIQVW